MVWIFFESEGNLLTNKIRLSSTQVDVYGKINVKQKYAVACTCVESYILTKINVYCQLE